MAPEEAEAVFVTDPASRSACVIVCEAVQVTDAPGATPPEVSGQLTVTRSSDTVRSVSDTLPLFVTRY